MGQISSFDGRVCPVAYQQLLVLITPRLGLPTRPHYANEGMQIYPGSCFQLWEIPETRQAGLVSQSQAM